MPRVTPQRFGLVAHRGGNAALLAGDHRPSLELRPARLLARGKEGVAVDMHDGAGKGLEGEGRRFHAVRPLQAYLRTTPRTTAAIFSSSVGWIG